MIQYIAALRRDDKGAVTVDWVVLTAAIVGLSVAVMAMFLSAAKSPNAAYHTNMNNAKTFVDSLAE
ncbi:hypothetical protein [Limimaricola litoreus]|uniref:Pilus assembly protein n=1 Tax=Limimaricola litoreus TaxID=2955316 RepID=A0A9X2FWX0_9RHOB|nr:hypothetical protein [Limimaricola litoreus]MCP1169058.1 hypothetical protein [Limimaricola litoreus]